MKDLIELKQTFTKENPFVTLKPNIFNLYIESMFDKIFSQLILFFLKQIIDSDYI